jgi:hypothetical protein
MELRHNTELINQLHYTVVKSRCGPKLGQSVIVILVIGTFFGGTTTYYIKVTLKSNAKFFQICTCYLMNGHYANQSETYKLLLEGPPVGT